MVYPAACKDVARARAKFPAPTTTIRGFFDCLPDTGARISGSIADRRFIVQRASGADVATKRSSECVFYIVVMAKSRSRKSGRKSANNSRKARVLSSRTVYRGPAFWVTTDQVQEPGGVRARRDIVRHSGSVVVLAVDQSRGPRVLLERQYRHAANSYLWEIPAGRIDPGEKPLPAAKRELLEETGYTAEKWRRILKFYASPGFVAETMSVFLATGLHAGKAQPEADEIITKRLVPLPMAVRMVLSGTIRDAKTISSILWFDHQLRAGRK